MNGHYVCFGIISGGGLWRTYGGFQLQKVADGYRLTIIYIQNKNLSVYCTNSPQNQSTFPNGRYLNTDNILKIEIFTFMPLNIL